MDENFDYKTAKIIIENNYGFMQMRKNNIFTFDNYYYDRGGNCIIDGCDEYYCMELTKTLCEQLSKGFAELSLCFKTE